MPPPSREEISRHLERMLNSPNFHATPTQIAFLKYIVTQTLAGNAGKIKGYTVAIEVFGRGPDFDQRVDPVVSIQASGLRRALEQYYKYAAQHDEIRINIPKGTYVPVFEKRLQAKTTDTEIDEETLASAADSYWPSVLVRPLRNLSGDPELDFWGIGLAAELANELNRYPDIRVMTISSGDPTTMVDQRTARFEIGGSFRSDGNRIKVIVQLTDTRTGYQIWSDSYRSSIEAARRIDFQEDIARAMAMIIAGKRGWITMTLDKEFKHLPPQHSMVYEAVLRYFEYDLACSSEAFSRALGALEKAVTIDPEYGHTWSMLAKLYAEIFAFDIPGYKNPIDKAFEFAQNGTRLSPGNRRCRAVMAYVHLIRNDLKAGLAEAERALQLDPETLFMLDGIGYLLTLLGAWERGPALIEKVIHLNPFYGNFVHFALWVTWLRQDNFLEAYQETLKLNRPAFFWDHLARASTLGLLDNIEEGRKAAAKLLKLKPDFAERGRLLIGHFIKFEDIVERVIEGLNAVGIKVD